MLESKLRIITFVSFYLPGFKAGGPIRTIENMVSHFADDFEFWIVTRDREKGAGDPYRKVAIDDWNTVGNAKVFYSSKQNQTLQAIARLLRETPHDMLYLNSFFDFRFSGLPLIANRLQLGQKKPCLIAPRGEFSPGALLLKKTKKRLYLFLTKNLGLYKDLSWQASSLLEADDIRREFGVQACSIYIAPDLPSLMHHSDRSDHAQLRDGKEPLSIIFLSRISQMKNLDYLLRVLSMVSFPTNLSIYGPIESKEFWFFCLDIIRAMPSHISVSYHGALEPDKVHDALRSHDLFVLPTRGENFGHAILESLIAGTPVLISDKTPWRADDEGGVTTLPLDDVGRWVVEINKWAELSKSSGLARRNAARRIAGNILRNRDIVNQNKYVFEEVSARCRTTR